jgi:hypothetical protein
MKGSSGKSGVSPEFMYYFGVQPDALPATR